MEKLGNVLISVMQDLSKVSTGGHAHIKINRQLCEPKLFGTLFQYFKKGTILENINLTVEPLQTQLECPCGYREELEDYDHKGYGRCPECGQFANIRDDEYELVEPDPGEADPRENFRFS